MKKSILHITNGSVLTEKLEELDINGEYLTWYEMLCEGPTTELIDSEEFLDLRKSFFKTTYDLEIDEYEFHKEIDKLNNPEHYSRIILWFEYDLFCHINLVAVISLLIQKQVKLPIYLVCSGRIKGDNDLKGLGELTTSQLLKHYKKKVRLSKDDIELALSVWKIYCGSDHNLLKPFIIRPSSYDYLSNCLKAHLERFPDSESGLCIIEKHILNTIKLNDIKSKHHLLGYILNYQGYYGYGDIQLQRMINKLDIFFNETENGLQLNEKAIKAISNKRNFFQDINNNLFYGGVNRLDYTFDKKRNKLIKK